MVVGSILQNFIMEKVKKPIGNLAEVTDAQAKVWIKQDLHAAMSLMSLILDHPVIFDQVAEVLITNSRSAAPLIDDIRKNQERKAAEAAATELEKEVDNAG